MHKEVYSVNNMCENKKLDVTIVTINWNVTDKLQKCINSVIDSCNGLEYEMFVIDNNSEDFDFKEISDRYRKYKSIKFIVNKKNEGALALNKIRNNIRGRYLIILGPDTILKKNTIKELIKFMDSTKDAGAASGKLLNPDGSPQLYYYKFWNLSMVFYTNTSLGMLIDKILRHKKSKHYFGQELDVNKLIEIDQPPAACLIIKPEILLEDGYIVDPEFPFYYNDVDICKRIWDKGYMIYLVPTAEVIHDHGSSFKKADVFWKKEEYIKSQIKYFKKYYQNKVVLLKTLIFVDCIVRILANCIKLLSPKRKNSANQTKNKINFYVKIIRGVLRW